ncbi:MAG: outer membrane lipoprotein carrier protein LolA [Oligoflexia bacterium]|nr:outer membrane lipoprotein carrier protein LolA [Oligoflexia bacterium]
MKSLSIFIAKKLTIIIATVVMTVLFFSNAQAKTSKHLREVEDRYRNTQTVKMHVSKTVKSQLLDKVKTSQGEIQVKKGGRLRWETTEPDHSLIVVNKDAVWLVDFPTEKDEKIAVLKAQQPKKSQPQALVAFLMGQGHITSDFVSKSETTNGDSVSYNLKPKDKQAQVIWLTVVVNKKTKTIETIMFEDTISNTTTLEFSDIKFDLPMEDELFKFIPPKNSDVTLID